MILASNNETVQIVRAELDLKELPRLLAIRDSGRTALEGRALEKIAVQLVRDDFPTKETELFVRRVCLWGGGQRIAGRVKPKDDGTNLSTILKKSVELCHDGKISEAVSHISESVKFLGISFSSKQMRFLAPRKAVILDSVIRETLGYSDNIAGYRAFHRDCDIILKLALECQRLTSSFREQLRICDIEVALYLHLQELKQTR